MIRLLLLALLWLTGCQAKQTLTIDSTLSIFKTQANLEETMKKEFNETTYSIDSPYLVHDPYQNSPLSYLVMFETEEPSMIKYQVLGHTEQATLSYETNSYETTHQLTLIGLYPNESNTILLSATNEAGQTISHEMQIQTPPLPSDSLQVTLNQSTPLTHTTRLFLATDDTYKYLIDEYGDIRFIQNSTSGSITSLPNGNLLTYHGPYYFYYQQQLEEISYLGQVQKQLYIPGSGHHSLTLTPDGNYIINSSDKTDERYTEDHLYILDAQTGIPLQTINLRDYLDINRFKDTLPESVKGDLDDWFHLNYAMIDESDETVIASGRSQSMVVKLDPTTKQLKWILGAPDEVNEQLKPYLLTPIGENFTWFFAQHSSKVLEDLDQNPDTVDLILFDNHVDIGVFPRESYPDLNQYSRAVHYRINEREMTVEQIWSFGENLSPALTSTIISEVDYLPKTKSMLVLYGFIQLNQSMGGKLFEVSATDSNDILMEMTFNKEGINHIYAIDTLTFDELNLNYSFTNSNATSLAKENLMSFKEPLNLDNPTQTKSYDSSFLSTIELVDDVLYLDGYVEKAQITDSFALVLTNESHESFTYSIHSADCYAVKTIDELPTGLQNRLKKAVKKQTLVQFIDRTDLSNLEKGTYRLSFYLKSNDALVLYETDYSLKLH
ncbi:aryl-sulfate sulfotransferase [Turicibacter sanguinis]|uniref:aryl-sulfate sulfotransferase n=1 Tax=Turicibacter sanguinis TaxID=154288 RepID=UPI0023314D84|nr:aryl-sulfate sulfotransferase [Turicibacter sanguinis]MDB8544430.1 aryl-sulfate sulfotransferase [Turicibacter sanguinis]